jgi:inhibitor of cysteine peptidase
MRRTVHAALVLLVAALAAAACGGESGVSPGAVTLTEADDGTAVRVAAGGAIVIELESNPSTGYSWQLGDGLDEAVVKEVSQSYSPAETGDDVVGSGGVETWTFSAVGPGTTEIRLEYLRPFEQHVPPVQTFVATVDVGG